VKLWKGGTGKMTMTTMGNGETETEKGTEKRRSTGTNGKMIAVEAEVDQGIEAKTGVIAEAGGKRGVDEAGVEALSGNQPLRLPKQSPQEHFTLTERGMIRIWLSRASMLWIYHSIADLEEADASGWTLASWWMS